MTILTSLFEGAIEGFREVAFLLLACVNFVMLALVYFTVVAATSIVAKTCNKHFLNMSAARGAKTHWNMIEPSDGGIDGCLKQF